MIKISKDATGLDKLSIIMHTLPKMFRGSMAITIKKKFPLFIGKHTSITHKYKIYCGKNVKFEEYSEIHGLCSHGLYFGNNVTIGRNTVIRPSSYYGVGNIGYGIDIGENSSVGPYGYIGCSGKVQIGNDVMIGPKVSIFAENHNFADKSRTIKSQGVNNKGIKIENDCWIGSNVIILDGVTIGHGSIIGAGTLIAKDVPANSIVYDKRNKEYRHRI